MLDSDMMHPPDAIHRLWATGKGVVGANYFQRFDKTRPMHGGVLLNKSGNLQQVDWVGTGCILIRRRVLEQMSPPWFFYDTQTWSNAMDGEDMLFCRKAKRCGFDSWVNADMVVDHLAARGHQD
jgi:GT2 family glycosyltransferase